ncbi:Equilibrative nucleoside transporter 4-like [Oopsacas minuta]|uniref:Equilibrative nucleoside transporter 4-like n=1 Tax=Oopsacas minuta TaxID=111878 RepID=A0AAV7K2X8_9METZ|nr:Equilibrative nucleoside transporter 4-like [Oopsacas minuta]
MNNVPQDKCSEKESSPLSISTQEMPTISIHSSNKPKDYLNLVYFAFLYQGMALLFPYNAFIFLIDFYQERFCDLHLFYWSMITITILSNALFCLLTNIISDYISVAKRILTGHICYLISLVFFLIFSILVVEGVFDSLPNSIGYTPLLAGLITGVGIGISQPSYYAISSYLPSRYTQALVVGETISGVTSACFRVATKLMKPAESCQYYDTLIYISLTLAVMMFSVAVWVFIYYHKYTNYYLEEGNSDMFTIEYKVLDQEKEEEIDDTGIHQVASGENALLLTNNNLKWKDKLVCIFVAFKKYSGRRIAIFKKTCSLQLTLFFNFAITLFLFPTFITAAYKCHARLCDWVPIITLTVFMSSDFIIRWFSLVRVRCSSLVLLLISLSRVLFIPLICLFIFPLEQPIINVEYGLPIFLIVVCVFGLTNGYFGSVPLVIIPTKLNGRDRQLGSSMGIFMLVFALVAGTFIAFPFNQTVLYKSSNVTTNICCLRNYTSILQNATADGVCMC